MDKEQLENRVKWLDAQRTKDKQAVSQLQKKITKLEGALDKSEHEFKLLSSEVTRLSVMVTKVDGFDNSLNVHRTEVKKEMDKRDKLIKNREQTAKKRQKSDIDIVNKTLIKFNSELEEVLKLKQEVLSRNEKDTRLNRMLTDIHSNIKEIEDEGQERRNNIQSLEEERLQHERKFADLQGEVSALRKHADEHKAKLELSANDQTKLDMRLKALMTSDEERYESIAALVERVTSQQADKERLWIEWSKHLSTVQSQSEQMSDYLLNIEESQRKLNSAKEAFEEITSLINRRINEITEMQRLGEERIRQDFSTFKADDQKRWTNYSLTQEEQQRELDRKQDILVDQVNNLDDLSQDLQDVVQHLGDQSEKRLQELLSTVRDWVAENERFVSSLR